MITLELDRCEKDSNPLQILKCPANQPCRRWMLGAASLQGQLVPAPRRRLPSLAFASGTGFSHSSRSATRGPYRYTWLSAIQLKGNIYLRTDKRTQKRFARSVLRTNHP
ncbi:hypothetical protein KP509_1Z196500 [Ceratopteris richardii]|nr:hypothetical protein KP509_1Z196500 [Ceratopteris richardii]